jgi:ABC-2 type transport system ATP-binding protein
LPVIETKNLVKSYRRIQALKGVSIAVEKGEIYGLLGQNGAGKTTLIKILLGITRNWRGEAQLLGQSAQSSAMRRRVGYLPEDHRFPEYHTGFSLLDFYGGLYSMSRAERRRRIPEVLEMVGIQDRMHYKIRTYSKGMKQRLGIAQTIFHDPEVIFLDEPTDGVDPIGRREIRTVMQRLKDRGTTIFVNSHLLGEVEIICDRVGIMQRGNLVREGTIAALTRQKGFFIIGLAPGQVLPAEDIEALLKGQLEASYTADPSLAANTPAGQSSSFVRRAGDLWEVSLLEGQSIDPVLALIHERGLQLRHLVEKRQSLEDLFVKTVQGT